VLAPRDLGNDLVGGTFLPHTDIKAPEEQALPLSFANYLQRPGAAG
jgi:hypothetical protein